MKGQTCPEFVRFGGGIGLNWWDCPSTLSQKLINPKIGSVGDRNFPDVHRIHFIPGSQNEAANRAPHPDGLIVIEADIAAQFGGLADAGAGKGIVAIAAPSQR